MAGVADKFDKAYEDKPLGEAPVAALQGVGDGDAEKTQAAFNIKTVRDLGTNPGLVLSVTGSRHRHRRTCGWSNPTVSSTLHRDHRPNTRPIPIRTARPRPQRGHFKATDAIVPSLSNCADWHLLLDDE